MNTRHLSAPILAVFCCSFLLLSTPLPALAGEPLPVEAPAPELPPSGDWPPEGDVSAADPTNDQDATVLATTTPEVSPFTGSLTYAYPIVVPPGRNGIAPNLTLTYSSQGRNGLAGIGWTIDLGSIQRSTRYGLTYGDDGDHAFVASINGNTADLIRNASWSTTGVSCYQNKIEGAFSRYCLNGSDNTWTVTGRDGTKYLYGSTAASRQDDPADPSRIFRWCLDKVEDTNGNFMAITYMKDTGEIYPSRIEYTGNAGLAPTRYVAFYTEPRSDVSLSFVPLFPVGTARRLITIETGGDGLRAGACRLSYVMSAATSRSLISRIERFAGDVVIDTAGRITGGTVLPAVGLGWEEAQPHSFAEGPPFSVPDVADPMDHRSWDPPYWTHADFNGDGTFTDGPEFPIADRNIYYDAYVGYGDFNGDGRTDMVYKTTKASAYRIKFSNGDGTFTDTPEFLVSDRNASYNANTAYGDFNGDGRTDIMYNTKRANAKRIKFSNGDGTFTDGATYAVSDTCCYVNAIIPHWAYGDFDGDGRTDMIYLTNSAYTGQRAWTHRVRFSRGSQDLLTSVENGIGAIIIIGYTPSSSYPNTTLPFVVQTVGSVSVNDGNGVTSTTGYRYARGLYNHADREFYGFGYAIGRSPSGTLTETFFKQREATGVPNRYKGFVSAQAVSGPGAKPWDPGLTYAYTKNFYTYAGPTNGPVFPHLYTRDDHICDGSDTCRRMRTNLAYDGYGNVTGKEVMECAGAIADVDDTAPPPCQSVADKHTEYTTYAVNESAWILNRPLVAQVYDGSTKKAQTRFAYDGAAIGSSTVSKGNLTAREEWNDKSVSPLTAYTYNAYGNQTSITDPKANTTFMSYDSTHTYVNRVTNALGHKVDTTWDIRFGKPLTKTMPYTEGSPPATAYTYDTFGRPLKIVQPLDAIVTFSYNDFGSVGNQRIRKTVKDGTADGLWSETYFDGLGRVIAVSKESTGTPIVAATVYNEIGKVERQYLPCFAKSTLDLACATTPPSTTFTYDPMGRVERSAFYGKPAAVTTVLYDKGKTSTIDPEGHVKGHIRDIRGRLVTVEEYTGIYPAHSLYATTTYAYDVMGNLVTVTDNGGNTTTVVYDSLSRKIAMDDMDMGVWSYGYDENGNLISQTDARGQVVTFTYDSLNRIIKKRYPSGKEILSTYDGGVCGTGRLTSVTDLSGSTSFTYDVRGRTVSTTKTITGLSGSYTTRYAYDSLDRTAGITYPTNMTVTYSYDKAGSLNQVAEGGIIHATYDTYTASGQVGRIRYRDPVNPSVTSTYTYDPENARLKEMTTVNRSLVAYQDLLYAYDRMGRITAITDGLKSDRTQHFSYDEQSRLVTAEGGYGKRGFRYNEVGNMMYTTTMGDYTYPVSGSAHPHGVIRAGMWSHGYDENGNMKKVFYNDTLQKTIDWTPDNKPSAINGITFTYDYAGRRVKKTGSSSTYYIDPILEQVNGAFVSYIFANGKRIVKKTGTTLSYYHTDHLGSTGIETDQNGTRTFEAHYTPYGETWYTSSTTEKYRFTGQEEDAETGLYNYGARHYDPALARFISPDSIVPDPSDPQSLNRYSYCRNNPVMYVDPSGHLFGIDDLTIGVLAYSMLKGAIIGAGVGAGVSAATGGDIGTGALTGAIGGAIFGGAGSIVHGMEAAGGITSITKAGIHAAAGAMSGGVNAGITGTDIGAGMLAGGLAAGIAAYVGVEFLPDNDAIQVGGRVLLGATIGGTTSAVLGGDFGQGALVGGSVALLGELLNDMGSPSREVAGKPRPGKYCDQGRHYSDFFPLVEGQSVIHRGQIYPPGTLYKVGLALAVGGPVAVEGLTADQPISHFCWLCGKRWVSFERGIGQ